MVARSLVVLAVVAAALASPSPCPDVFEYDTAAKKQSGRWDGVLTFDSEFPLSGLWIRVILDKKAEQLMHEYADVKTDDHVSWLIKMPNVTLTPGSPVKVPFHVKYDEKSGEPAVAAVRLNARDVCPKKQEFVNISPCPGIFKFTNNDKPVQGKWFGELTIDSEFPLHGTWIRVYLDNKGQIQPNGFGEVETRDSNSYLIRNKDNIIKPGSPLKVPFIVSYDEHGAVPNVSKVRLNGRTICESKLLRAKVQPAVKEVHESHEHEAHARSPAAAVHNVHNHQHHH